MVQTNRHRGVKDSGTVPALDKFARVLAEAKGEAPRALVRMPDKAIGETEKRKRLIKKLRGLNINEKIKIAENSNTDKDMLDILGLEKDWMIRMAVALNENVSVGISDRLSRDEEWGVRQAVAENENDSLEILERLSEDKYWQVRASVARNENISVGISERLSGDKKWWVREAVALNGKTPIEILKRLQKDADADVSNSATAALKKLQENLEKLGYQTAMKKKQGMESKGTVSNLNRFARVLADSYARELMERAIQMAHEKTPEWEETSEYPYLIAVLIQTMHGKISGDRISAQEAEKLKAYGNKKW